MEKRILGKSLEVSAVGLAPVQVKLLTVTGALDDYAREVAAKCEAAGLRVELDLRNEKIGTLSVFSIKTGELGIMETDRFIAGLAEEIQTKSIDAMEKAEELG